jgi:hypothetical protein
MRDGSMNDREMIEAIEACRPGSDDLHNSEWPDLAAAVQRDAALRRRYEETRAWDRAIGEAMQDVAVPAGLSDRLWNALQSASSAGAMPSEIVPSPAAAPASEATRAGGSGAGSRKHRRWAIALAGIVVSAAVILVAVFVQPTRRPAPQPTPEFASEVIQWSDAVVKSDWRTDFSSAELRDFPLDEAIRGVPRRWTRLSTRYHRQTLVYDLTSLRDERTYVFCFPAPRSRSDLPSAPPLKPFSTTGGFSVGTWQRNDQVYVLAAQGGEHRYRSLIQSTIVLGWSTGAAPPAPSPRA